MDRLKLHTPDLTAANIDRIAALFPNCVTETIDESGKPKRAIDFDLLRQELSENIVAGPQERYRLDWPGKREALALANQPITKTLRPCREESVDFENTQNLYIEGDNLDALKLLHEAYLGKVKMIYIDPPYNTGNDFIYDDNFSMNRSEYEERSGDRDEVGNVMFDAEKWKQNSSANGRFHSEWLSMMYPRLKLARSLLREDGLIFISIDDGEAANLKRICDEIFGESNFLANLIWEKAYAPRNNSPAFSTSHDHILCYAKTYFEGLVGKLDASQEQRGRYTNRDNDPRGDWKAGDMTVSLVSGQRGRTFQRTGKGANLFSVTSPSGRVLRPSSGRSWVYGEDRFNELIAENRVWWGESGDSMPSLKRFWNEIEGKQVCQTIWKYEDVGHNQEASKELKALFEEQESAAFSTPKPLRLIDRMLRLAVGSDSIILDFFSGSATTAHAVMQLNAEDGGKRRHIMVQLPEPCDEKSEPFKAGYKTIAEIGKERIRRAGQKILQEWQAKQAKKTPAQGDLLSPENLKLNPSNSGVPDIGFRVLKIADSNFREIERTPEELDQKELALHTEHIKPDRTAEDLLFQVLVDWGLNFALPIVSETLHGKRVFFVDENALAACFDTGLSDELVHAIAARKPLRAVFRDDCFGDDSTRINVDQIFKLLSPGTEVKAL
jgi:adenine-specific DNA-methyltransferase